MVNVKFSPIWLNHENSMYICRMKVNKEYLVGFDPIKAIERKALSILDSNNFHSDLNKLFIQIKKVSRGDLSERNQKIYDVILKSLENANKSTSLLLK